MRTSLLAGQIAAAALVTTLTTMPLPALARHRHAIVPPSADAIELAGIAPPTRRGTVEKTYGDAAFARARMQSRYSSESAADTAEAATAGVPYPCDPRAATADAYVCRNDPRVLGYGQGYAFTPSYVSAPTVFNQAPDAQEPVMPSITGFFWAVNSARFDPH